MVNQTLYGNITAPLNLENIFVNHFAGDITIFMFLAMGVFAWIAAKYRMPNIVFGAIMVLFIVSMSIYTGQLALAGVLVVGDLIIFYGISKIIQG